MRILHGMLAAAALLVAVPGLAQDKPDRREGVTYGTIDFIRLKPNKAMRLQELEDKYFLPAGRAAGLPDPVVLHPQTGQWHAIYWFPTKMGLSVLEYRTSPEDVAFMAALAKTAGGADKAKALIDEWEAMIDERVRHVGHVHDWPK